MKDKFVRHVRALLATGSSARSVREQLFLNGGFFLSEKGYAELTADMPELRWFQTQREGLGNESLMYTFLRIAQCEEVVQWGFDETSLNGIPTLNQWCRIKESDGLKIVTLECAGLLTGSTSTRVAEHIKVVWQRGVRNPMSVTTYTYLTYEQFYWQNLASRKRQDTKHCRQW